ncbi:RidA family protein [Mesorhizobium sp. B2-1-3A]|uniref:RidA family protein n=1 Tax=Mesorhizobium sp. B2-1-3A TaxID=2589971 RepID=UPI001127A81B|nr:RidA family protein [Mesorhizobium sp. B2-1-3A]TPM93715.1 RidA family protein [Mesorhizobium sp. B2-1-3A]
MTFEAPSERLRKLGLTLPPQRRPVANFLPYKQYGHLLFLSGQGPVSHEGVRYTGKVGLDVSVSEAYQHAQLTTLNLLAVAEAAAGSIDRVAEIVKVLGFVNAAADFTDHPAVINGCSDLLVSLFGEQGMHARSAIGAGSLPNQITVEIEMIVALAVD